MLENTEKIREFHQRQNVQTLIIQFSDKEAYNYSKRFDVASTMLRSYYA